MLLLVFMIRSPWHPWRFRVSKIVQRAYGLTSSDRVATGNPLLPPLPVLAKFRLHRVVRSCMR
jgi:hypothetical protein